MRSTAAAPASRSSTDIHDSKRGNLPILYVSTMSTEPTQGAKEVKRQDFMSPSHLSQSLFPQSFQPSTGYDRAQTHLAEYIEECKRLAFIIFQN